MSLDIATTMNYEKDSKSPGWYYARQRTTEEMKKHDTIYAGNNVEVKVTVKDGRNEELSLDQNSFQLVQQETKLTNEDFYEEDPKKIKEIYYPEIAKLIKENTGAAEVVCFHHQVRNADKANGDHKNLHTSVQPYAMAVHSDSSPISAEEAFLGFVGLEKYEKYKTGRFLYINAWRSIADTPIGDNHLALCDETSLVKPDDYLKMELFGQGYHISQYKLADRNASQHRWYYFSKMKKDEVILFKQWDSDPKLSGRVCFHTAFKDPKAPSDTPTRESIEVRAFAFFPDHEPNTCPAPAPVKADHENPDVPQAVAKILGAFKTLDSWPQIAKDWAITHYRDESFKEMAVEVSRDAQNHFGLKNASKEVQDQVVEGLMKDDQIEKIVRAWATKYLKNKGNTGGTSGGYLTNAVVMAAGFGLGWAVCKYGKPLMQQFSSKKKK